jgi:RNA polymerase sigma-70 factor, ECF subfamily
VAATKPQVQASEAALLERVAAGDTEAFYELVRPCERALFLAARGILGNDADAEEIAQEAVLKAFSKLRRFRGESKFSTWLIQIALNEARMRLRKERRTRYESLDQPVHEEEGDYVPRDFADWREIPLEALQKKELREALSRAIASLPPKYREVLVLRDIDHLSITETAMVLGISEVSVKTRLLRARLQMRDALAPGIDGSWSVGATEYKRVRPW